ncbi:hypothetical protein HOY80DRAFT_1044580 [Tuber brumale]|nr:hypothetical protein HOY80DRAFT_1044580 [Tuber brumale]
MTSAVGPGSNSFQKGFIRQLLEPPEGGVPNKAIILASFPGQASYVNWFLRTVHSVIHSILYYARVVTRERDCLLQEVPSVNRLGALILTPALGGTGLNLVAANQVIIMQSFWNLSEQCQAVTRGHCNSQRWSTKVRVLHCQGVVDDRVEELHQSRGRQLESVSMSGHHLVHKLFPILLELRVMVVVMVNDGAPGPSGDLFCFFSLF